MFMMLMKRRITISPADSNVQIVEELLLEPEPRLFSFNNPYGACPNVRDLERS